MFFSFRSIPSSIVVDRSLRPLPSNLVLPFLVILRPKDFGRSGHSSRVGSIPLITFSSFFQLLTSHLCRCWLGISCINYCEHKKLLFHERGFRRGLQCPPLTMYVRPIAVTYTTRNHLGGRLSPVASSFLHVSPFLSRCACLLFPTKYAPTLSPAMRCTVFRQSLYASPDNLGGRCALPLICAWVL